MAQARTTFGALIRRCLYQAVTIELNYDGEKEPGKIRENPSNPIRVNSNANSQE